MIQSRRHVFASLRRACLRLKVAIFQPELQEHAPRTTLYLKAAIFEPELPRTRDRGIAGIRKTTSKGRFASKKIARRHSKSASTRAISADGSPRLRQIRAAPQRERFDARAISAEGRARAAEIVKHPELFNLDRANLRRGWRAAYKS